MAEYYINREIVRERLYQFIRLPSSSTFWQETNDCINNMPVADVAPVKHGQWLSKEYMYGDPDVGLEDMWVERLAEHSDYYAYCSECGKDATYNNNGELILSAYCPNCGADMRRDISNFTPEEQKIYWEAIEKKSINTGINIHNLI